MSDANTGVPAKPLTEAQLTRLTKMGDPFGAFGEELTYLPRAVEELKRLRRLVQGIRLRANHQSGIFVNGAEHTQRLDDIVEMIDGKQTAER